MPTKPIEDLLLRELPTDIETTLASLAGAIEETVNFGTQIFKWCVDSGVQGNEHGPIFLSFRHILEMLDSISVLVKKSCFEPSNILLRSIFEAILNIEYLLKDNFAEKAIDFLFMYQHDRLRHNKKMLAYLKSDKYSKLDPLIRKKLPINISEIEKQIQDIEESLSKPASLNSKQELERYRAGNNGRYPLHWFNLRKGPRNISELADRVGKTLHYLILYKEWSRLIHGTGIFYDKFSISKDGRVLFTQFRLPKESGLITSFSISFALETFRIMLDKYAKDKIPISREWYAKEIREVYSKILEIEPIIILDSSSP